MSLENRGAEDTLSRHLAFWHSIPETGQRYSCPEQPENRTDTRTSLFPGSFFDLNHDGNNSNNSLFHLDENPAFDLPLHSPMDISDTSFPRSSELSSSSEPSFCSSRAVRSSHSDVTFASSAGSPHKSLEPHQSPPPCNPLSSAIPISRAKTLRCLFCPRTFTNKALLKRHAETHSQAKYVCTKGCLKNFTLDKDRVRHEETVHGDGSVFCEICRRKGRKDNIKRHMKVHQKKSCVDMKRRRRTDAANSDGG